MTHKTVVRNEAYQAGGFNVRERHNERKNETYHNSDIELDRAHLNIHFRQNFTPDGTPETYEQTFNRLLDERKIVRHGIKPDAKVFCEMIFDVNSAYFEECGGYDFAKKYFEEAYRLAVKEVGSEDYILSAVVHADECNKALSDELGRDVYHYHLHIVYVPVVEKKLYFRSNNKDPALAGKLKEIIPQISQSNKWPLRVPVERDGKTSTVNSYSLLQDRYFEHMRAAGFDGFERGERGSSREHLSDLEYKTKMENERLAKKQQAADSLDASIGEKQKAVSTIENELKAVQGKVLTSKQIDKIPVKISRPFIGGDEADIASMPKKDWNNVKKTAISAAHKDEEYRAALSENAALKKEKSQWQKEKQGLVGRVKELEGVKMKDAMAGAARDAELHNLKNVVARIPQDVWDMYTKQKAQQKNRTEVR
jgi:hypothetical protein